MLHRTEGLVWRLSGKDPLGFLEATTTADHQGQAVGETRWCCVLDPGGRVLAFLRTIPVSSSEILLDGDPLSEQGIAWLASIAPLSGCKIVGAPDLMVARGSAEGSQSETVARGPRADGLPGEDLITIAQELAEPGPEMEAARIAEGWPRFGVDVTTEQLLNDTPLLELCTSFTKGCYRGQETVAKIANLGHARRGYVRVRTGQPFETGAAIEVDGSSVGAVTSAAAYEGEYRGIAIVKREHLNTQEATVAGHPASLEPLIIAPPPERPPAPPAPPRRSRTFGRR